MNETTTASFSLDEVISICGLHPEDLYFDGCIVAHRGESQGDPITTLFRHPVRIDAFVMSFCVEGSISISSNLNSYRLENGTMYIHHPEAILHVPEMRYSDVYAIICKKEFIDRMAIDLKLLSGLLLQIRESPLIRLDAGEREELLRMMSEFFAEKKFDRSDPLSAEIMRELMRTAVYRISRIIDRHTSTQSCQAKASRISRNEDHFKRFMDELSRHYTRQRSVGFYAGQLHLTPKYLTTVVRKTSGRPATDWIDDYVILEAKNLLKYSSMSVQEIAYALNFPNQSFFGRYFKKHTGHTPSAYRTER